MKIDGIEDNGLKDSIKTFRFKETNAKTIEGDFQASEAPLIYKHRCSLDDISQIARHYLIKSSNHPKNGTIRRHYTEAFCMRKEVYENLLKLAKYQIDFDVKAIS